MESCNYQYHNSRYDLIYIYADCWSMCSSIFSQPNNCCQCNTNFCCNTNFDLPERNSAHTSCNFGRRRGRNMEPCYYQYSYRRRTYDLYIYSDSRSMCSSVFGQHNNCCQHNTNFCYGTNFDLPERNSAHTSCNFGRRRDRNMEPCYYQYSYRRRTYDLYIYSDSRSMCSSVFGQH